MTTMYSSRSRERKCGLLGWLVLPIRLVCIWFLGALFTVADLCVCLVFLAGFPLAEREDYYASKTVSRMISSRVVVPS